MSFNDSARRRLCNVLGKREKAIKKHFLLFPKFFCQSIIFVSPHFVINPLPNDKILDWSKFKVFADDKINVNQKLKFTMGRVEHIAGKGENAGYQHFLLFPQCFQKASFSWSLKVGIVW